MGKLANKVAVVTGASKGYWREYSEVFGRGWGIGRCELCLEQRGR
jgi:hypothetical protein